LPPIKSPTGRTNYLLLGSDNDSKNLPNTDPNTQSIIFVSYDSIHRQAYMISIPRDLYVLIPGFGYDKIDTAPGYDNLGLVVRTVEDAFHVNVDHYAWVGLRGFVNIIDSLGGVDIVVSHPMVENDFPDDLNPNSSDRYGYLQFFIAAGPQHLNGVTALEYVRARHADRIGDFGRSQRQQQVLLQLKQKLKGIDLSTVPSLVQDLQHEFRTDLTVPEILGLARTMLGLKSSDIHSYRLTDTGGYVSNQTLKDGNEVLMPNWDKINALVGCVMSDKAYLGCQQ
jgi:LCP family protein required for cell wall assembly